MPTPKSPVVAETAEKTEKPKYTETEEKYLSGLIARMEVARTNRNQSHEEFDGMSYEQNYDYNERIANTFIAPKKNKEDSNFQSGIVRQKLFSLLAAVVNLNLAGDISAFDDQEMKIQSLGNAMEDIVLKTNEYDGDEEKKLLRHLELFKQGTVFVEEIWDDRKKKEKVINKPFDGSIAGAKWSEKLKKAFARPSRNIISGKNVYLGDITQYDHSQQPEIFTVETTPYINAQQTFGEWERWKNVPMKLVRVDKDGNKKDWTLTENVKEGYVEIVRYQSVPNNEFAVIINGVLMTPVGLPLPWGYDEYNIAQQNFEPIHSKFAYGKSLVSRMRNKAGLLDEMLKLMVLKTQKSFLPPYLNLSGRVLSNRVLMPGKISHGIPPNTLVPVNEKEVQGVTPAEFNMVKEIMSSIDAESVSPTFQGQEAEGDPTATEIIQLQRQAKVMLGLTIFAVSTLEWKLEWLRIQNLLVHWFDPVDQVMDDVRGVLKNKYRTVGVDRPVEGQGMGRRIVVPTEDIPSSQAIMAAEDSLSMEQGTPVRLIFLNPQEVCSSKMVWRNVIVPKEKPTSEMQKLMFRAFMQDATMFGPMLNLPYLGEEFANTWQKDPNKIFKSPEQMAMEQAQAAAMGATEEGGGAPAGGSKTLSPRVNMPTPEKAMGTQVKQEMQLA